MNKKQIAAEKAVESIQNGMRVGLGTGSTAYWAVIKLGERMKKEGIQVQAVPTSEATKELAIEHGIPLLQLSDAEPLDLTIDGADEVSPAFDLIKGGGGALFREKMVAAASKKLLIIADDSKLVNKLGAFKVPVEIVPFAWETTARRIEKTGCKAMLRRNNPADGTGFIDEENTYITDNGNYIVDCDYGFIEDPHLIDAQLHQIVGVVETGFFLNMTETIYIGKDTGVEVLQK